MAKQIDPVTLQVIYHRLVSIAEEMEETLVRSSFSPIIKEARDCATTVFDAQGRAIAQSATLPIHLGTLISSVPEILRQFGHENVKEGDVYLANDPYAGGTHVWDVTIIVPVIYQGEVVAWAASINHHMDMGAMTPGVPSLGTSLYQEGLVLPPVKFYDAGKPVKAVHDIIRKNIRIPDLVLGDMGAQVAAGNVGRMRILALIDEYGKDMLLESMEQLINHSEVLTREELRQIPDGVYTGIDYMDNDGIDVDQRLKIQVTITIKGSDIVFDFSGSSPQTKGPYNSTFASSYSVIGYITKVITGGSAIPNNAGCFRPIKHKFPRGSIVNPYSPASCGGRVVTTQAMVGACYAALAKCIPKRILACSGPSGAMLYLGGYDPLKKMDYVFPLWAGEGLGARATKDGIDSTSLEVINCPIPGSEASEMDAPIMILERKLSQDSGGPGEYRGGLGTKVVFKLLRGDNTSLTWRGDRYFVPTWGMLGGLPGGRGRGLIMRTTGEEVEISSKGDYELYEGDIVHFVGVGGGGYGDPLKRKPEFVLRDVLDGRVSLRAAADDYGVAIDRETRTINEERTTQLRKDKAKLRGPITWTIDRGPDLGRE